jgi:hypothetical protein
LSTLAKCSIIKGSTPWPKHSVLPLPVVGLPDLTWPKANTPHEKSVHFDHVDHEIMEIAWSYFLLFYM